MSTRVYPVDTGPQESLSCDLSANPTNEESGWMYTTDGAPGRAQWEVLWIKKGRVVGKDCGTDFHEALRVYTLAAQAEKPGLTLKCKNMSFPPPEKYADSQIVAKFVKGKRVKVRETIMPLRYQETMSRVNLKGLWWCPYCVKMRKFKREERVSGPVMACPICKCSNQMGTVRMYNPHASRDLGRRTRSDKGVGRAGRAHT